MIGEFTTYLLIKHMYDCNGMKCRHFPDSRKKGSMTVAKVWIKIVWKLTSPSSDVRAKVLCYNSPVAHFTKLISGKQSEQRVQMYIYVRGSWPKDHAWPKDHFRNDRSNQNQTQSNLQVEKSSEKNIDLLSSVTVQMAWLCMPYETRVLELPQLKLSASVSSSSLSNIPWHMLKAHLSAAKMNE